MQIPAGQYCAQCSVLGEDTLGKTLSSLESTARHLGVKWLLSCKYNAEVAM